MPPEQRNADTQTNGMLLFVLCMHGGSTLKTTVITSGDEKKYVKTKTGLRIKGLVAYGVKH